MTVVLTGPAGSAADPSALSVTIAAARQSARGNALSASGRGANTTDIGCSAQEPREHTETVLFAENTLSCD